MQYKTLATLLFATAAIAAPASEDPTASDDIYEIPSSIESVLVTGIPTTWINDFYSNSDFQMSEISAMEKGDYPAWVTSLPSAAEAYFTSEIQAEISEYNSQMSAMSAISTGDVLTVSGSSSGSSTPLATTTSGAETTNGASSTGSSSDTNSTGSSSSGASSSGSATSTSSGGAAAATGGLAMSLAGAAGILGVALAL
ncbi:uncharacterized protein N7503_011028 [Penicillium pulvis]|uniref:uncharacterized protein n=1 Tax=Penicillium pulvis TaxID=1562058 RepID=UPI0025498090|nr:uncharacterized protein N7503_011028 [Penicillium pulvis]KAJ5785816.1 hypothetical protein N7503_011028 [Penicillium pulvis]